MIKLIKKLGIRRFLKLFWSTYKAKYCAVPEQSKVLPSGRRDNGNGPYYFLGLVLGSIFTFEPILLYLFVLKDVQDANLSFMFASVFFGLIFLAVPIVPAISLLIKMKKNADVIIRELPEEDQ